MTVTTKLRSVSLNGALNKTVTDRETWQILKKIVGVKYSVIIQPNQSKVAEDFRLKKKDKCFKLTFRATMGWFKSKHRNLLKWPSQRF